MLGAGRFVTTEVAAMPRVVPLAVFGRGSILDLRAVQADPVMRARLEYSLMAALPRVGEASAPAVSMTEVLPILETRKWRLSEDVVLTFPLAITGRNLVTAEIAGAGQLGVAPTGLARGGVFTFTGAF